MKADTVVVSVKGLCLAGAAMCATFGGALSQWSNSDAVPSKMQWAIIIAATLGSGFTAVLSFISSSFSQYMANRAANALPPTPQTQQPPVPPAQQQHAV